jgi:hypothetical protein
LRIQKHIRILPLSSNDCAIAGPTFDPDRKHNIPHPFDNPRPVGGELHISWTAVHSFIYIMFLTKRNYSYIFPSNNHNPIIRNPARLKYKLFALPITKKGVKR